MIIFDVIPNHPSSDSELREAHIVKGLSSLFSMYSASFEALRTNPCVVLPDIFVDALNSLPADFGGYGCASHFTVGSDVDSVALIVPTTSLVNGFEGFNGTGKLRPHRFLG